MNEHRTLILDALSANDIEHDAKSLAKHDSQGLMSSVYTIATPSGGLIIHVSELTSVLEQFQIWKKLKPISRFLRSIPGVPTAEVLFAIKWPHRFLIVQKRLPGHAAGTVGFKNDGIVFTWQEDAAALEDQLEDILANIHMKPVRGFGQLVVDGESIRGEHDTWEEFLRKDVPLWIDGIAQADLALGVVPDTLIDDVRSFQARLIAKIPFLESAVLVSCDALNPSNILVENGTITGIVDWEWSLAADPAWEFAYGNRFSQKRYFQYFSSLSSEQAQKSFLQRAKIYEYLLYAMWTFAVSDQPDPIFYEANRNRLKKKYAGAQEFLVSLE